MTYSSLVRGLAVLEAIGEGETRLSALADRFELDRSAMSRLVQALEADGWVTRTPAGPVLGPRSAVLGSGTPQRHGSRRVQRLVHLAAGVTGCDVAASVLSGGRGYHLAAALGREPIHDYPSVVEPFPLWAAASGQAMAAQLPEKDALALLPAEPFGAFTSRTITTTAALQRRWRSIRRTGVVVEHGEMHDGVGCVAVPWRIAGYGLPGSIAAISTLADVQRRAPELERVLRSIAAPDATEESVLALLGAPRS